MKPKTSIILPVRFRPDLVRVCLDSMFQYTPERFEIILVLDGENPEMEELAQRIDKVVRHKKPQGYVKSINDGYKKAAGDYIMFLNSDTVVTPGWLTEMLKTKADVVVPTLQEPWRKQHINENRPGVDIDYDFLLNGACILFKREVLEDIKTFRIDKGAGPLDEIYGIGGADDHDISLRLLLKGYKPAIARKSFIYHYNGGSFRKLWENDLSQSTINRNKKICIFKKKFAKELKKYPEFFKPINERPRVLLLCPHYSENIYFRAMISIIQQFVNCIGIKVPESQSRNLAEIRNDLVRIGLKTEATYFLWLDSDQLFPQDMVPRLLAHNKDICGAWVKIRQEPIANVYKVIKKTKTGGYKHRSYTDEEINKFKKTQPLQKVDRIGFGSVLIKREVFEKMPEPWFALDEHHQTEDLYFCDKAREMGYEIFVDWHLRCGHLSLLSI